MLSVQRRKRRDLERYTVIRSARPRFTVASFLGLAFATSCSPPSSGENDPNAIYGSQAGKNTFIVSHVFNASVYEKQLGFALPQAPEFSTPDVLLQCFYELQLTDQEMDQCGRSTGVAGYSNPLQTALNEQDIWRLMILQSEKTAALSEFVVPQSVFNDEAQTNWKGNNDLTILANQTAQVTSVPATETAPGGRGSILPLRQNPDPAQLGLVNLRQILNPGEWFKAGKQVIETQFRNSANCLTTQNPLALAEAVVSLLSWLTPAKPINSGLGVLLNFIRPAQQPMASLNPTARTCGSELVRAVQTNAPATTQPPAAPLQAIENAVTVNDPEALKRLIREETTRQIESINSTNFQMKSTLRESANKVPGQTIAELRSKIKSLSDKVGPSLNGARCFPAKRFVAEVLRPVLSSSNNGRDSASDLADRSGCKVTNAAPMPKPPENTPVAQQTKSLADKFKTLIADGRIISSQILAGFSGSRPAGAADPVAASATLRQYQENAPGACSAEITAINSTPASELADRLKTCSDPLGTSDATHTFGKFSDALRQTCAAASAKNSLAIATCLCSCRWSTAFYKFLSK